MRYSSWSVSALKARRKPATYRAPKVIDGQLRIVSCANDTWQVQRLQGERGDKTVDPWKGLFKPTTLTIALQQVKSV